MDSSVWDNKYSPEQFVYGEAPNEHVRSASQRYLTSPCQVVELASGEGRNAVFLAQAGHSVTAVDFSQTGLDKTVKLAQRLGPEVAARITPVRADVLSWRPEGGPGSVDAVVLSFCHVPAAAREGFMAGVREMLKPGGYLIQEVFHPNQVHKGYRAKSGGPHDPTMMVELEELRRQLGSAGGQELEGEELEYELQEGELHSGLGSLTRYVWRKAL